MTALPAELRAELRASLRKNAGAWIARFYRHELLVARTVRGMQVEAQQEFDREIVQPLLREIGGRLATFQVRGQDVVLTAYPELVAMEREMSSIIDRGSDAVRRLTTERLDDLTRQETDWVAGSARAVLKIEPVQPTVLEEQDAAARPWLGQKTEEWFESMLRGPTGTKVRAWVQTGLQRGLTTDEIVRGLRGTKTESGILEAPRHAVAALVRTAATHVSAQARMASFQGIGVDRWRFVATLDSLTSVPCAFNDGKTFPLGEGPVPPLHVNCLPGDALVSTVGEIAGVAKRWFDGEVCVIRTASGRVLTATPNHPILTDRGWFPIGALAKGDHVVCDGRAQWGTLVDGDDKDIPTAIHEVAESFFSRSDVASVPVPVSAPDFHGDATDGYIAVVGSDRGLRPDIHSALTEHARKLNLVGAGYNPELFGDSSFSQRLGGMAHTANGSMGGFSESDSLFGRSPPHSSGLLLASIPSLPSIRIERTDDGLRVDESELFGNAVDANSVVMESHSGRDGIGVEVDSGPSTRNASSDNGSIGLGAADTELADQIRNGGSGPVFIDQLEEVRRIEFSGHVYNLETTVGFYTANGIVTHNCRSTAVPDFGTPVGERASVDGPVSADKTFAEWLEGQSAAEQNKVLGATKADAWRAGKLTLEQMLGRDLEPLTLAELRAMDRL